MPLLDISYIAGLFDGEGSVSLTARRKKLGNGDPVIHYLPTVSICQAHEPILRQIREFVGFGAVCAHGVKPGTVNSRGVGTNKACFQVLWSYEAAIKVARLLIPHTHLKTEQLQIIVDYWSEFAGYTKGWSKHRHVSPEYYVRRDHLYDAAEAVRTKLKEVRLAS